MERRKIELDEPAAREQIQLPLPNLNPARRRLEFEPGEGVPRPAVETVTLRVDKETAAAVRAGRVGAVSFVAKTAAGMMAELLTDWSRGRPPSSGYWELKQHSARTPDAHCWFYVAQSNQWHRGTPQMDSRLAGFVDHGVLMQAYEWRGLRQPWPHGYDYPLTQPPEKQTIPLGNAADEPARPAARPALAKALEDLNPAARRKVQL